jgi:hypothetical protein
MKFSSTLSQYLLDSNIVIEDFEKKQTINDETINLLDFLLEARKAKADLYKDLTIQHTDIEITPEDVANIKFYHRGKSVKDNIQGEELNKINTKQASLFNNIFQNIVASATNNKITLIELTAAAIKVFRESGQNAPTAGYNLRGLLTVFIKQKKMLEPVTGEPLDTSGVDISPAAADEGPTKLVSDTGENISSKEEPLSKEKETSKKFDSELQKNTPKPAGEYFKVDKNAKVDKSDTDFSSRYERTEANYVLNKIKEYLPGTLDKKSLADNLKEDGEDTISPAELSTIVDKLVNKGLIQLVPKSESSEEDKLSINSDDSEEDKSEYSDTGDITDKFYGFTRKGFGSRDPSDFDF